MSTPKTIQEIAEEGASEIASFSDDGCNQVVAEQVILRAITEANDTLKQQLAEVTRERDLAQSKARDMQSTYEFGAKVMNKVCIPNIARMVETELPFDFICRVVTTFVSTTEAKEKAEQLIETMRKAYFERVDSLTKDLSTAKELLRRFEWVIDVLLEPQCEEDRAYQRAVRDCCNAIQSSIDYLTKAAK